MTKKVKKNTLDQLVTMQLGISDKGNQELNKQNLIHRKEDHMVYPVPLYVSRVGRYSPAPSRLMASSATVCVRRRAAAQPLCVRSGRLLSVPPSHTSHVTHRAPPPPSPRRPAPRSAADGPLRPRDPPPTLITSAPVYRGSARPVPRTPRWILPARLRAPRAAGTCRMVGDLTEDNTIFPLGMSSSHAMDIT